MSSCKQLSKCKQPYTSKQLSKFKQQYKCNQPCECKKCLYVSNFQKLSNRLDKINCPNKTSEKTMFFYCLDFLPIKSKVYVVLKEN